MNTCEDCRLDTRVETLEEDFRVLQSAHNDHGITLAKLESSIEYIKNTLTDMYRKIDKLSETPQKRWDTVVNVIITVIVAGLISMIIGG